MCVCVCHVVSILPRPRPTRRVTREEEEEGGERKTISGIASRRAINWITGLV